MIQNLMNKKETVKRAMSDTGVEIQGEWKLSLSLLFLSILFSDMTFTKINTHKKKKEKSKNEELSLVSSRYSKIIAYYH